MIAWDCETTGLDFRHGCRPFFISMCTGAGELRFYEWDVDPKTRLLVEDGPDYSLADDVTEMTDYLFASGPAGPIGDVGADPAAGLVLHNAKFDMTAFGTIGVWDRVEVYEAWKAVRCTLMGAHLLQSNSQKTLTDCALIYLGHDMKPAEERLEEAVKEVRREVRKKDFIEKHGEWDVSTEDHPMMPSNDKEFWRGDYWLPRAYARAMGLPAPVSEASGTGLTYQQAVRRRMPVGHPYWTVLRDYANEDSAVTVALWTELRREIARRGLSAIFEERMKILPITYRMEERGVTISAPRVAALREEYRRETRAAGERCYAIAAGRDYNLTLPKGGVNDSLRGLIFDVFGLEQIPGKKSKTAAPSLDKDVMEHYKVTLEPGSEELEFIQRLSEKRIRDTAIQYLDGYHRFWRPWTVDGRQEPEWYTLHPNFKPTGTDTLRFGCSNPNAQNISKKEGFNLRFAFGPAPGREWWSLDAKAIEARLPAYESGQRELIELFENPDAPPYFGSSHFLNFHTVYPDLWDEAVREAGWDKAAKHIKKKYASTWYQYVKNGGFAVQYGAVLKANGWGTADRAFHKQYSHRLLVERFDRLDALNRKWINYANRHGYVETIPDKSIDATRGYPIRCTRTEHGRILETVPLNYHIQSSAMWWTCRGMVRCQEQMDHWNREIALKHGVKAVASMGYFMAIQVHDEIVFDFPKRAHPKNSPSKSNLGRVRVLQRLMEKCGDDYGIPTPVGVEYNETCWSEGVTC
jgi:hypothetical protein